MPRHPDRLIERLAQPEAARLIAASGTAVVFAGSVEQHGGHLPLGTDTFAAQSIAERAAARLGTVAVSLGPVGIAHYHLAWPGTLSLSPGHADIGVRRRVRRARPRRCPPDRRR